MSELPPELLERLKARRGEIEAAVRTRVYAISDSREAKDPAYLEGLRAAVSAAIDYGLAVIERGEERAPPPPAALLAQARMAARAGVSLETVLRRYLAGYTLISDFLVGETERGGLLRGAALGRLLRSQAALFDRLIAAVSEEYEREAASRTEGAAERRAERVGRLLDGELLDTSGLAYEFEGHHLGLLIAGEGANEAIRSLAAPLDCRTLVVDQGAGTLWAWLGSRRRLDPGELQGLASETWPARLALAIGEPGRGLPGWRLSHRQAKAALAIALRAARPCVRYAEVAILASAAQDDLLATSLGELYLAPLAAQRDGGEVARQTLRAYFAADRNVSSAAAALGVNRSTVAERLRTIETKVGRPLGSCAVELEVALGLEELGAPGSLAAATSCR